METVTLPFSRFVWVPDGADAQWQRETDPPGLSANAYHILAPEPSAERTAWRSALQRLRERSRENPPPTHVRVAFGGVRAWTRLQPQLARAIALQPGERVTLACEARWLSGNPRICLALDFLDPVSLAWKGWSGVFHTAAIPADGQWHPLQTGCVLPQFDPAQGVASLILGQDATHDPQPGVWEIRGLTAQFASTPERMQTARRLREEEARASRGLDRSLYARPDLQWSVRNFACYLAMLYDLNLYDPVARKYTPDALLQMLERRFGGVDSIVLWHAYPRIGLDDRNQFDYYRDMPGGLPGLKRLTDQFHRRGVKVFLDYNPWDTGTRREPVSDAEALAKLARDVGADGLFLDTMTAAPPDLRPTVDAHRSGVIFEPEGAPPLEQISDCSASWAQGFPAYPAPALLRLKWIEPRHMQHQIHRWSRSHMDEIEQAFFNGSGMLIWENVFGSYNPWRAEEGALWSRAVAILRAFAGELSSESWEPFTPTLREGVYASRWSGDGVTLTLLVNRTGTTVRGALLPPADLPEEARLFDLWRGIELRREADGAVYAELDRLGAIVWTRGREVPPRIRALLNRPAVVPAPTPSARSHDPRPIERTRPAPRSAPPENMVYVPGGEVQMRIRHERRECGCYPDPGAPPERLDYFLIGNPFQETLVHDYRATVAPFWIDACLVTNGEYETFLQASGYRPKEGRSFLKHWGGRRCPDALRDHPVVYVDLDDARAYARWAGKRLPTEPEWHLAGQGTDGRRWPWGDEFDAARCNGSGGSTTPVRAYPQGRSPWGCYDMTGNVWQWTESERSDGHTRYAILRGGCAYDAPGSLWYLHGGAQPLDHHAKMLLLYPGLDRCATIGFRCVRDAE